MESDGGEGFPCVQGEPHGRGWAQWIDHGIDLIVTFILRVPGAEMLAGVSAGTYLASCLTRHLHTHTHTHTHSQEVQ